MAMKIRARVVSQEARGSVKEGHLAAPSYSSWHKRVISAFLSRLSGARESQEDVSLVGARASDRLEAQRGVPHFGPCIGDRVSESCRLPSSGADKRALQSIGSRGDGAAGSSSSLYLAMSLGLV